MKAGARVWIRNLSTMLKYNGLEGVIFDGPPDDYDTHVYVRLDQDNHELRLKVENVFVQDNIPIFTVNSPKFMDPRHRIISEKKAVVQTKEDGKGDGMKAICEMVKGDRIVKRDDQSQAVLIMPSIVGCAYVMPSDTANSATCNRPFFQNQQMQDWIDVIYFHYRDTDNVCSTEKRFVGGLCGLGGCGSCGLSSLTLAALKYAQVEDMDNPDDVFNGWAGNLLVDTKQIMDNLQLTEILLVVNFILTKTLHTRDPCVRLKFALRTWKRIGVWKVNGISGYMPLETLHEIIDPRLAEMKKDTRENLKSWGDAVKQMLEELKTSPETSTQSVSNGIVYVRRLQEGVEFLEKNKLPHHKIQENVLGHAVQAILYEPYMSKINGAREGDIVNCSFMNYFHCPRGNVEVERDLRNFICIEKDIQPGEFLCVAYNTSGLPDYFRKVPGRSLQEQIVKSSVVADIAQSVVEQYSEYLPEYVVTYLKGAQQQRRGMEKKTRAELAETRQKIQDILEGECGEEDEGGTGL